MSRTEKEIMQNDIIIQEIDAHIDANHLEPLDKLMLRVMKYNRIDVLQIKDDLKPVFKQTEENKKNPSLIWSFRNQTGKTMAVFSLIVMGSYFILRVLEMILGIEAMIKPLLP